MDSIITEQEKRILQEFMKSDAYRVIKKIYDYKKSEIGQFAMNIDTANKDDLKTLAELQRNMNIRKGYIDDIQNFAMDIIDTGLT